MAGMIASSNIQVAPGTALIKEDEDKSGLSGRVEAAIRLLSDTSLAVEARRKIAEFIRDSSLNVKPSLKGEILYQLAVSSDHRVVAPLMEALPHMMNRELAVPALVFRLIDRSKKIKETAAATLGRLGEDAYGSFAVFEFLRTQRPGAELADIFKGQLKGTGQKAGASWESFESCFADAKRELARERRKGLSDWLIRGSSPNPSALKLAVDVLCANSPDELREALNQLPEEQGSFQEHPNAHAIFASTLAFMAAQMRESGVNNAQILGAFLWCCFTSQPGLGLEYPLSGLGPLASLKDELLRNQTIIALSDDTLCQDLALQRILSKIGDNDAETYRQAADSVLKSFENLNQDQRAQVIDAFFKEMGRRLLIAPSDKEPIEFFARMLGEIRSRSDSIEPIIIKKYGKYPSLAKFRPSLPTDRDYLSEQTLPAIPK